MCLSGCRRFLCFHWGGGNGRVGFDEWNRGAGFKWRAIFLLPPPSPRTGLPALVRVHVQVELRAQVEVEKGVDAEDEEEDRHDDQERILQDRAQFTLPLDPASSLCCALFNELVAFSWMSASPPRGVSVLSKFTAAL